MIFERATAFAAAAAAAAASAAAAAAAAADVTAKDSDSGTAGTAYIKVAASGTILASHSSGDEYGKGCRS